VRLGTWLPMIALEELSKLPEYKLWLVGVQEVRWDRGGVKHSGEHTFFYRKGNDSRELGTSFLMHKKIISAIKRVEFVSILAPVITTVNNVRFEVSRRWLWRMVSSGMLRRVALVRTDVSEELSASFIRVTRISELGTTLAVTSNRCAAKKYKVRQEARMEFRM
jgi:hypothetical protein